jgi:hypothetical protein
MQFKKAVRYDFESLAILGYKIICAIAIESF